MKFSIVLAPALLLFGTFFASSMQASARCDDSPIYAVDQKIEGKTHEEWSVAFFRWAFGIKKDRSPITDQTGEFAAEGQSGAVWFLAGNFGGVTRRKLSVPAGKPIFSPVIYSFPDAGPAKESADRVKDMEVTLDGKSIGDLSKHRVTTRAFEFTGPVEENAVHAAIAGKRAVALNGYWFMLKPLSVGEHTLRIKGRVKAENVEDEFELDITYKLKVEEGN